MKKYKRVLLVTLALSLPTSAGATSANQLQGAWAFLQQLQSWSKNLTNLQALKDDLFGQVDYKDLAMRLGNRMLQSGLNVGGVDLNAVLGPFMNNAKEFQKKVDAIRDAIRKQTADLTQLSFLDDFEKGTQLEGTLALNPDLAQMRMKAGLELGNVNKQLDRNVQDLAKSSQVVEESKKTVTDLGAQAKTIQGNAKVLTESAQQIQSTREGVQLLVRAQAETMLSQAYNATAITTSISQMVRQTQVSNNMLSEVVNNIMQDRRDNAMAAIRVIRLQQAQAANRAESVQEVIDTAAQGIGNSFEVDTDAIDVNALF